jgi:hypothetical protein
LYHLGVARYLRDADLLSSVSHITSVSGGSVFAAHLALNWDRYCGTPEQFDEAAREILDFVRLDVRNRIIRRYRDRWIAWVTNFSMSCLSGVFFSAGKAV